MDFPYQEYQQRLSKLQEGMEAAGLPALLIHQPQNIRYISGFFMMGYFFYHALLVPAKGDPVLIVRDMEAPAVKVSSWIKTIAVWSDNKDPMRVGSKAVREALSLAGIPNGRVGTDYQSWFLTPERLAYLTNALPDFEFVPEPHLIETLRIIKSKLEIEQHRQAARVVEAGVQAGIDAVHTGVRENQIAGAFNSAMLCAGGELAPEQVMTSGERTSEIHGGATARVIQPDDNVYFELTGNKNWYVSRLMRTVVNGKATDEKKRVADTIIRIQNEGIAMMQPGVRAGDVDAYMRKALLESGIRTEYTNRTSYGIGLTFFPSVGEYNRDMVPNVDWVFEPGMVQHALMMGQGMGFSETVLITEDGPELITQFERNLIETS